MYARRIVSEEQTLTLTFAVSGKLWHRSLVMIDVETESLWSHILGKSMAGKLMDLQLEVLPGLMTDWKTWRQRHPNTTVLDLSRTSQEYRREFYQNPSQFVIGVSEGKAAKSWSFDVLAKQPVVNDHFDGVPVLIAFDNQSKTAFLYDRRMEGATLEFMADEGVIKDRSTGSQWDSVTGRCVSGSRSGQVLPLIPAIISFRETWRSFHPEGEEYRDDLYPTKMSRTTLPCTSVKRKSRPRYR